MTGIEKVIGNLVLKHANPDYNPAEAHAYYMRTRQLKGRKLKAPQTTMAKPSVKKPAKRVEEDQVPMTSPSGAKLLDYNGSGAGRATYTDGSTFDGNGWNTTGHAINTRLNAAQQMLMRAKGQIQTIKDPVEKKRQLSRLADLQKELNSAKNKQGNDRKTGTIS